jgi:hypothetical protein
MLKIYINNEILLLNLKENIEIRLKWKKKKKNEKNK